ncbi:hypothetical protein SAMN02990966_03305 [Rhodospirillales bacterium URHD0017]|nr:hypothetical protein SAMN02990966_03305 [Rhodospirillales bacterium URHD0017]
MWPFNAWFHSVMARRILMRSLASNFWSIRTVMISVAPRWAGRLVYRRLAGAEVAGSRGAARLAVWSWVPPVPSRSLSDVGIAAAIALNSDSKATASNTARVS